MFSLYDKSFFSDIVFFGFIGSLILQENKKVMAKLLVKKIVISLQDKLGQFLLTFRLLAVLEGVVLRLFFDCFQ